MIAILPAAGRGTRMTTVTTGAKELLPIGGLPVLRWVLQEAEACCREMVVIVSPDKPEVEALLSGIPKTRWVTQGVPNGLAAAVALASGSEPALVFLPDTIFVPLSPANRLANAISKGYDIAIAVEEVPESDVSRYGIVEWNSESGRILRIIEKPSPGQTSSRWAIAARFGLSARTMDFVKKRVSQYQGCGELHLPPVLDEVIQAGHTALAIPLEADERRLDCGNPASYRAACEAVHAIL